MLYWELSENTIMDPCLIAADLLAQCASNPAALVKAEAAPTTISKSAHKTINLIPSAHTTRPEAGTTELAGGARNCSVAADSLPLHAPCTTTTAGGAASLRPRSIHELQGRLDGRSGPTNDVRLQLGVRPGSGNQLFAFRTAALQAGELYSRTLPQRYQRYWQQPRFTPDYGHWKSLLAREAAVMAQSQGRNRLTILVGDSLSLWLPTEQLPQDRFWLNQSISGETTSQVLARLHYFRGTRPTEIHIMAGINDLKNGASDGEVIRNIQQMLVHLRQQHPQARLVIYSILPTRLGNLPSDRIRQINRYIAYVAAQQGADFADLQATFSDHHGLLRREFTTDGLHLSQQGYRAWQSALVGI
jgi:lysophospholipase L1-like esterase